MTEEERISRLQAAVSVGVCFGNLATTIIIGLLYGGWKVIQWMIR